jgi:hypothetical protein
MKAQISGKNSSFPTADSDISHRGVLLVIQVSGIALDEKLLHLSRSFQKIAIGYYEIHLLNFFKVPIRSHAPGFARDIV